MRDFDDPRVGERIAAQTAAAGKQHGFDETHDPRIPAQHWFQETPEGRCLFLVFYTQACRWSRCVGCNLPSKLTLHHVGRPDLMKQVDHVFDSLLGTEDKGAIARIILSNNGSVLDEVTFSTTALLYFVARMAVECPVVEVLCLETRCEYVDWYELEVLARALGESDRPTRLELAIGFEVFDDAIRNNVFGKGLTLEMFEEVVLAVGRHGFGLKVYFMLKPVPKMSDREAVEDIHQAIDYLDTLSRQHHVPINLHLNPTYVARGTLLEEAFRSGTYAPPTYETLLQASRHAAGKAVTLYLGLNDEGLAVEGGSLLDTLTPDQKDRLEEFNRSQEYRILDL